MYASKSANRSFSFSVEISLLEEEQEDEIQ